MVKRITSMGTIIFIFLLGIGFILYPTVGNYITLSTASVTISEYDEMIASDEMVPPAEERLAQARLFNEHLYYGTNEEGEDQCLNVNGNVIAYLEIPKINVYLPVYYGTDAEDLQKGCGYILNTSLPVGGKNTNSAISGHTGLPGAELLSDLDQLVEGDVFYIHVLGEVLAYEVDLIATVEPTETELLEIQPGRDLVSIVTCTPYGINTHRLIVQGERIDYVEEEEDVATSTSAGSVQSGLSAEMKKQLLIIAFIVVAAAIAIVAALIYDRSVERAIRRRKNAPR